MSEDMAVKYVRIRLADSSIGTREAARAAGYARGVPSERARRLYEKANLVGEVSLTRAHAHAELQVIERQIAELREMAIQKREWLTVCEIVV